MTDMSRVGEIVLSACDEDWKEVSLFRLKPLEKAVLTVEPEGLRSCRQGYDLQSENLETIPLRGTFPVLLTRFLANSFNMLRISKCFKNYSSIGKVSFKGTTFHYVSCYLRNQIIDRDR